MKSDVERKVGMSAALGAGYGMTPDPYEHFTRAMFEIAKIDWIPVSRLPPLPTQEQGLSYPVLAYAGPAYGFIIARWFYDSRKRKMVWRTHGTSAAAGDITHWAYLVKP